MTEDNTDLTQGGVKYDGDKPRYDLLAPEYLEATSHVLRYGADKYAARNWEAGMRWGRPFAAMMRHMWAWWRGEKADPETGMSHLWHASCCLMFLIAYEERKIGEDDRQWRGDVQRNIGTDAKSDGTEPTDRTTYKPLPGVTRT